MQKRTVKNRAINQCLFRAVPFALRMEAKLPLMVVPGETPTGGACDRWRQLSAPGPGSEI